VVSTRVADSVASRHLWTAAELDRLVDGCARLLGLPPPDVVALDLREAPRGLHGSTQAGLHDTGATALLALETEGLVFDPDHTAPAFHVAPRQLLEEGQPVLFWHTGGLTSAISSHLVASGGRS
jgi:hypothetical protein